MFDNPNGMAQGRQEPSCPYLQVTYYSPPPLSPRPPQTINLAVNWFVFHADSGVLILSSGKAGNMLHPFQFKNQNVIKLPKFEVELSPAKGTGQSTLQVRCAKFLLIVFP